MKKIISISLLFIFITANLSFRDFLKFPSLVRHYLEHSELNNSSLIQFLEDHYSISINHPDNKNHDHENLPFKTINFHGTQIVFLVLQSNFSIFQLIFESIEVKKSTQNQQDYSITFLNSIWQPPRFN